MKVIDILCYISTKNYDELPSEFNFKGIRFQRNGNGNYISTTSGLLFTKYLDDATLENDLNTDVIILDESGKTMKEKIEKLLDNVRRKYIDMQFGKRPQNYEQLLLDLDEEIRKILSEDENENSK